MDALDWIVTSSYLLLVAVAVKVATRRLHRGDDDDYFYAGRSATWQMIILSALATSIDSMSYAALPSEAFIFDLSYLAHFAIRAAFGIPLTLLLVGMIRRRRWSSGFELFRERFGVGPTRIAASVYLLAQIVWLGVLMFTLMMPLQVATGLPLMWSAVLMGSVCTVYTMYGGFRAVVFTDACQFLVFVVCAAIICVKASLLLAEGPAAVWSIAAAQGKLSFVHLGLGTRLPLLGLLLDGFLMSVYVGSNQLIVQRYLALKDESNFRITAWVSNIAMLPLVTLIMVVGTVLFAYYSVPEHRDEKVARFCSAYAVQFADNADQTELSMEELTAEQPELYRPEQLLPHFVRTVLPSGFLGLLLAATLAACMSSFDSSLNNSILVLRRDLLARQGVSRNYVATIAFGAASIAVAVGCNSFSSLIQLLATIAGLAFPPLISLTILGMFTRRSTGVGWTSGAFAGCVVTICVITFTELSFTYFVGINTLVATSAGYAVSLLTRETRRKQ